MQTALAAVLYLEWYRARMLRRRDLDAKSKEWWRWQRTYGLCRAIRQAAEAEDLAILSKRLKSRRRKRQVAEQLRAAHPLEYRAAA